LKRNAILWGNEGGNQGIGQNIFAGMGIFLFRIFRKLRFILKHLHKRLGKMPNPKKVELANLSELRFDPENPRLPRHVDASDERKILEWMVESQLIIELMGAIGENDYFPGEPLLVVKDKKRDKYIVVEGNRRLAAVKLLSNPKLAPKRREKAVLAVAEQAKFKPSDLTVINFDKREDLLDYLGYRHVTGIKPWPPLAKAKYLQQLAEKYRAKGEQISYEEMALEIGSRHDYVQRLLTSAKIYDLISEKRFFGIPNLEETLSYSVLTTALSYKNIIAFTGMESSRDEDLKGLDPKNLKILLSWLFEKNAEGQTRVGESRNLKKLNKILGNEGAREAFLVNSYSLNEAFALTEEAEQVFRVSINNARIRLKDARDQMHKAEDFNQTDEDTLMEIIKLAEILMKFVNENLVKAKHKK
jgi:hypothetical protein